MKVALYARVSMDEKADDKRYQEPENQLEPLRQWAKSQDWEIFEEYVDKASGGDHNRPRFIKMLNDAALLKFKAILVWKLDRFSREGISHTLAYIERLKSRRIALKSMTESWVDTSEDNPISDVLLAILSWVAQEERRKISERTKLGIARRKSLGTWRGGRPGKTPIIQEVCELVEDKWKCKECGTLFLNEIVFKKKWSFHIRRHEWLSKQGLKERVPPLVGE